MGSRDSTAPIDVVAKRAYANDRPVGRCALTGIWPSSGLTITARSPLQITESRSIAHKIMQSWALCQ